jgi:hypothetical protein
MTVSASMQISTSPLTYERPTSCGGGLASLLGFHNDRPVGLSHRDSVICAGVRDNDDLIDGECLGRNCIQTLPQDARLIVGGNENRDHCLLARGSNDTHEVADTAFCGRGGRENERTYAGVRVSIHDCLSNMLRDDVRSLP